MAMLPFCGYHMADYWQHWLDMGERGGEAMPEIFHVNWFRKGASGEMLWPGFGENMRVLEWIASRSRGEGEAVETPIGYLPTPDDLCLEGLNLSAEALQELFKVDMNLWQAEAEKRAKYFRTLRDKLPKELRRQNEKLREKLREKSAVTT
jgi:phosphoenolpyruvate carboxykinase (GTP)